MIMPADTGVLERARQSLGVSADAIYAAVAAGLRARHVRGAVADIGAGEGRFRAVAADCCTSYVAVDVLRHPGLAGAVPFVAADLDREPIPLAGASVDVAVAIEIIEHLENPRALVRELVRIVRPGGWVAISTPNQLSLLSLASLVVRGQFAAFSDASYPAHRTALLEGDLRRIAAECGLETVSVTYTCRGRVPLTAVHYPAAVARLAPRALSDNVVVLGRRRA
jgi:SAM-dependent methyltransferase